MCIIGIDLGTINSSVSIWEDDKPKIITDEYNNRSIPSSILIDSDGNKYVGSLAVKIRKSLILNPDSFNWYHIETAKRSIGMERKINQGNWNDFPQLISAFVLAELKFMAERYLKKEVKEAVIAIPSHFDMNQRAATLEAASLAGLRVRRLINEATATALAYGYKSYKEEKVFIFDFGGGTLDLSCAEIGQDDKMNNVFTVLSVDGETRLGGVDFDYLLKKLFEKKFRIKYPNVVLDSIQKELLKDELIKVKHSLSACSSESVIIPSISNKSVYTIHIERSEFEQVCDALVRKAIDKIRKMENKKFTIAKIDKFLLVGGTGRIPIIRDRLENQLGLKPSRHVDIETCVAAGAAIQAGILSGKVTNHLLVDVIPKSLGIEASHKMNILVHKNLHIPTVKNETFTTTIDNQETVTIKVYQGEHEQLNKNILIGSFELRNIPQKPAGVPKIDVQFDINANGILEIKTKIDNIKEKGIEIKSHLALNSKEFRKKHDELIEWIPNRKSFHAKNDIKNIKYQIDNYLKIKNKISNETFSSFQNLNTEIAHIIQENLEGDSFILKYERVKERFREQLELANEEVRIRDNILLLNQKSKEIIHSFPENKAGFELLVNKLKLFEHEDKLIHEKYTQVYYDYVQLTVKSLISCLSKIVKSVDFIFLFTRDDTNIFDNQRIVSITNKLLAIEGIESIITALLNTPDINRDIITEFEGQLASIKNNQSEIHNLLILILLIQGENNFQNNFSIIKSHKTNIDCVLSIVGLNSKKQYIRRLSSSFLRTCIKPVQSKLTIQHLLKTRDNIVASNLIESLITLPDFVLINRFVELNIEEQLKLISIKAIISKCLLNAEKEFIDLLLSLKKHFDTYQFKNFYLSIPITKYPKLHKEILSFIENQKLKTVRTCEILKTTIYNGSNEIKEHSIHIIKNLSFEVMIKDLIKLYPEVSSLRIKTELYNAIVAFKNDWSLCFLLTLLEHNSTPELYHIESDIDMVIEHIDEKTVEKILLKFVYSKQLRCKKKVLLHLANHDMTEPIQSAYNDALSNADIDIKLTALSYLSKNRAFSNIFKFIDICNALRKEELSYVWRDFLTQNNLELNKLLLDSLQHLNSEQLSNFINIISTVNDSIFHPLLALISRYYYEGKNLNIWQKRTLKKMSKKNNFAELNLMEYFN